MKIKFIDASGTVVGNQLTIVLLLQDSSTSMTDEMMPDHPVLWSVGQPSSIRIKND